MNEEENKGITLVALIITIIVMLILVAVSVNIVIESNILDSTKNASQKTKTAYENERQIENNIYVGDKKLMDYIESINSEESSPKEKISFKIWIGDDFVTDKLNRDEHRFVTFEADEGMSWEDWCNSSYNFAGFTWTR